MATVGRRIDRAVGALVVEADVAAGDRRVEGAATLGQAADRFPQLPEDLRVARAAEIEVVSGAQRDGAGAGQVSRRLGHGQLAAFVRVQRRRRRRCRPPSGR